MLTELLQYKYTLLSKSQLCVSSLPELSASSTNKHYLSCDYCFIEAVKHLLSSDSTRLSQILPLINISPLHLDHYQKHPLLIQT